MKRKPGILSLVSARGHEIRESSSTPLWWKAVVGNKGPQSSLGFKARRSRDDDDDWREKSLITISERDGEQASEYSADEDEDVYYGERRDHVNHPEHGHSHLFFGVGRTPETMASWSGQPSVKGSTETSRMMLLTSASMGIAWVFSRPIQRGKIVCSPAAS